MFRNKKISLLFLLLFLVGWYFSGLDFTFIVNEVITRFIRDGVLALALIFPILAGMGINFAVTVGAICAQIGLLVILDLKLTGFTGLIAAFSLALILALTLGLLIGVCLNRVQGKEMIATIMMGFVGTSLYQLIFMAGYGTVISPSNPKMILSRGVGVRSMVDLAELRNLLEEICLVHVGEIRLPLFMLAMVFALCGAVAYITQTRLGRTIRLVGEDAGKATALGIPVSRVRLIVMVLSTVIACFGQLLFLQNIGMINVYTAHMNADVFAAAALLAGGATIRRATVSNVLVGIVLFHSLFIVSPQAGQHLFGNAALGEYFRSFVAYGTIAVALIINIGNETPHTPGTQFISRFARWWRKYKKETDNQSASHI